MRSRRTSIRTGRDRDLHSRMPSIATRTSASSPFSEFATWGGSSYNGTEQPRFSIKDDLTISTGSHTIKVGLHLRPAAGERLRSAGHRRQGRLQLPRNRHSRRDDAGQRRRQLVRVVPARRRGYRQDRDDSLPAAGLSVLRRSTRRTTGASTTSWSSTTACATSSRSRRTPAAISIPICRRPSRIRRSTTILARWSLPVRARDARARAACSPATTGRWRRA